ncbi:hypothetical protein HELRODRAFT_90258, partial [Helobdella robusta]|uniref:Uncharacterized protein n=1 Tax=Helobdella robusta TaxID=6412 RepID=T1G7N5_HELRO
MGPQPTSLHDQQNQQYSLQWRQFHLSKAKLKATSRISALLSGFAMVAMVETDFKQDLARPEDNTPPELIVTFSVITTLVVAVHLLALMISTCILPNIETVGYLNSNAAVLDSPHIHLQWYIEIAWIFSTGIGILLFLAQMAILAWVRFYTVNKLAPIASMAIIVPTFLILIAFAFHFYRQLIKAKCEKSTKGLAEL